MAISRRLFFTAGLTGFAVAVARPPFVFAAQSADATVAPPLLRRAMDALELHRGVIANHDVIGIADFSLPSSTPRFHLVNLANGNVTTHLVAHGRGSDPEHTGWLQRFSNEPHSNATSAGAYRTDEAYGGAHGRSMRLDGLDSSNSNAAARGIVIHGAWYASPQMAHEHGMLGRSQGCFAVADSSLDDVLARLGPGRLIYAGKA